MKAKNQLVNAAAELPGALTLAGRISLAINQGIGPAPMAKVAMNRIRDVSGSQPSVVTCCWQSDPGVLSNVLWHSSLMKKKAPSANIEMHMPISDIKNRVRRPRRSTSSEEIKQNNTYIFRD